MNLNEADRIEAAIVSFDPNLRMIGVGFYSLDNVVVINYQRCWKVACTPIALLRRAANKPNYISFFHNPSLLAKVE